MAKTKKETAKKSTAEFDPFASNAPSYKDAAKSINPYAAKYKGKGTVMVSAASFHDWKVDPVFVGTFVGGVVVSEKDDKDGSRKAGDVMGYNFVTPDGEAKILGASHSVTKTMESLEVGETLLVVFEGQEKRANGKPFNRFHIEKIVLDGKD